EFDSVKRLLEKYLTRITENTELKKHQSIQDAFSSYVEFEEVATCKQTAFINSFFSNMDIRFDFDIDRHGDLSYNECLTKDEELRYYIDKKLNNDNFKKENLIPNTLILNFNYTKTAEKLYIKNGNDKIINIHGELNNENNPIIFGYGDELDDDYERIERLQNNDFLENIKSIRYHKTRNYRKLLEFVALGPYQVFIMGHSCGNSDRTLLNTLFEHDNCLSIKVFYRQYEDGTDNYIDMIKNISRNFNNKPNMRDIVVNRESCSPLVPVKKEVAE
ncbi:bacteriophage abortive infection AbiH family protein, partial [Bacteroides ovatus]